ncbi:MAG: HlyD family efflux transporter periplasmic adaptor subunit [Thermoanaerobaculia bacterium]|nr:HlyD family efflux transporter periplasmic adaptor subunit [Thermoanaerobaculia bacterium]
MKSSVPIASRTSTGRPRPTIKPLLVLLACALWGLACPAKTPDPSELPLLGTLERHRQDLVASANEPIRSIAVARGQAVEAGQLLVQLDDRRQAARVEAARATVQRYEARIEELERGGRSERRQEARSAIAADRSEVELARLEVHRLQKLVEAQVSSQADLDRGQSRLETAQARLEASEAAYRELVAGATSEELNQAFADLTAARANVVDLEVDLQRLAVHSPVAGIIDALPYEVGEVPGAGAPVATVISSGPAWVRVYLPQDTLAQTSIGLPARIEVDGLDRSLGGCVRFVASEATFTPYYSLSEHDRHRLSYVGEIVLLADQEIGLVTGIPVRAWIGDEGSTQFAERCSRPQSPDALPAADPS